MDASPHGAAEVYRCSRRCARSRKRGSLSVHCCRTLVVHGSAAMPVAEARALGEGEKGALLSTLGSTSRSEWVWSVSIVHGSAAMSAAEA
jgi:hypothetical protein